MRYIAIFLLIVSSSYAQNDVDWKNYDVNQLNDYITIEVNKLRRKAKVDTLVYQPLLFKAAQDHADYMVKRNMLTHYQKIKQKKTPKNRVDFYGEQFASVGENVQVLSLKNVPKQFQKQGVPTTIDSYEMMAKILVLNWKNSPPHFKNMIHPDYSGTLTSISINSEGMVYACQLLSNEPFNHPRKNDALNYNYKRDNGKLYNQTELSGLKGRVRVLDDGSIYFTGVSKKALKKQIKTVWRSGIAADIVLKSQYLCGTNNAFNGKNGVRGIPMNPVFRRSFRKGNNVFKKKAVSIYLGKIPDWIDEQYELNLTVVQRKRTAQNHKFNIIPLEFRLDLDIQPIIEIVPTEIVEIRRDTVEVNVLFGKSDVLLNTDSLKQLLSEYREKMNTHSTVLIRGFSSIEGTSEINEKLYSKRADNISSVLRDFQINSNNIKIEVAENFKAFRNDIRGTRFEFLNELSDEDVRKVVNEKWKDSLEPILKNHRYAMLSIYFRWNDTIGLDVERLKQLYDNAVQRSDFTKAGEIYNYVARSVKKSELDSDSLKQFKLPETKEFAYQLFQKLLIDNSDSLIQPWENQEFIQSIYRTVLLNPKQKEVKSYYYWLLYNQAMALSNFNFTRTIYDNLIEQKNIDPELKTRILVSLASNYDEALLFSGITDRKEYLHNDVVSMYKKAGLTDDEMILMAQYLYYFGYHSEAKSLLKKGISGQSSIDDIVTYLKIMGDEKMGLSEKQYFNLFIQVAESKKEEFCTIFNSPQLNFQVMDDEKIKELYCEKCK